MLLFPNSFLISQLQSVLYVCLFVSLYMNKMKIEPQMSYQYPLALRFLYFASPEKNRERKTLLMNHELAWFSLSEFNWQKMAGVTSYKIDLDSKMVVVIGDIIPFEVLESVSKVKYAELWSA